MDSDPLLPPNAQPVLVESTKRTVTRVNWLPRFVFLALIGTALVVWNVATAFTIGNGYAFNYLIFGKLPLKLTVSEAETSFLDVLDNSNYARNWSLKYTQEQHLLGQNIELVNWTQEKFREYGLVDTKVETYHVYLNTPKDHALRLIENGKETYSAPLEEDALPEDPTSLNNTVPTFHGYSASGNVTAGYFYANYGRKEDYAALVAAGVDTAGRIAIVRYGEIYRGLKVKFAEEVGAIGVVMYSDPGDDGEFTPANGYKQYPHGPARNEASVQRGSVMYLSYGPGDPTTPGYASHEGVKREDPHATIPRIPSLPISYREVLPILAKLNGTGLASSRLGSDWVGKLPGFDYSIGPSDLEAPVHLNLFNDQEYGIVPIQNVLGTTPGILKNEVIIIGNHRDAWIRGGAGDPNSGSAAMLEILRALKELTVKGWKPYRTIIWASWDGEEPGLLGLTEWAEDHAKWINKNVVAYLNMDSAVSGHMLALQLSPVFNDMLLDVAGSLNHPQGGLLYEHFLTGPFEGKIPILGSGSDYTVFLEHLGVPSFDVGFGCNPETDPIYQYHLNYDSFYWMDTFTDPGFIYHNVMSKFLGLFVLRLSGTEVLQFNTTRYALDIQSYFDDALKAVPSKWYHHRSGNVHSEKLIELLGKHHNSFEFVKDFTKAVELTKKAIEQFVNVAKRFDSHKDQLQKQLSDTTLSFWKRVKVYTQLRVVNVKSGLLERTFLFSEGLKGRPWFKHSVFASGRYTGYAGQSLPGFREAVEDLEVEEAVKWLNVHWFTVSVAGTLLRI